MGYIDLNYKFTHNPNINLTQCVLVGVGCNAPGTHLPTITILPPSLHLILSCYLVSPTPSHHNPCFLLSASLLSMPSPIPAWHPSSAGTILIKFQATNTSPMLDRWTSCGEHICVQLIFSHSCNSSHSHSSSLPIHLLFTHLLSRPNCHFSLSRLMGMYITNDLFISSLIKPMVSSIHRTISLPPNLSKAILSSLTYHQVSRFHIL